MANYNTFVVVNCKTRKPVITTSSARKAYKELHRVIKENNKKYVKYAVIHLHFWSKQFSLSKISDEEKQAKMFGLQMQVQFLMKQLQDFYPVLETKVSELSKDQVTPEGTFAFFITKRTQATPEEIETYRAILTDFQKKEKTQLVASALYEWHAKNTKNYVQQQQQAKQNEKAPAQK